MKQMRGPLSLCVNEELGCLVEGFDTPPFIMMPHHRPYQGGLIEAAGLQKAKDLFAWRYTAGELPQRALKAHASVVAMPEVKVRTVDLKNVERDVRIVMDVYNDAWSENWDFVPMTEAEIAHLGKNLKMLVSEGYVSIADYEGCPAAMAVTLPNINAEIADLGGKLFPMRDIYVFQKRMLSRARVYAFRLLSRLLNFFYYKVWFMRIAPRLPLRRRPLWRIWIRSNAFCR